MATLDIFNDDAFHVSQLTQTIVDIPRVPTLLGDMNLFAESGVNTPTFMIERTGSALKLVPTAPRGGVAQTVGRDRSKLIPLVTAHLPQRDTIMADEVYGARATGSETEVESVQKLVQKSLKKMKGDLDLTLEHHRVGAIKGKVMDANGVDEILDVYQTFGMTQQTVFFNIKTATSTAKPKENSLKVKRAIQSALGGRAMNGVLVICSEDFFDKFVGHDNMAKAWDRWNDGAFHRDDLYNADFEFSKIKYRVYAGGTSAGDFIPAGQAFAIPLGVPDMFQTRYAPADYIETVNTEGVPYYAKQKVMDFEVGVDLRSQSNPLTFNTLPEAVIKLSIEAS